MGQQVLGNAYFYSHIYALAYFRVRMTSPILPIPHDRLVNVYMNQYFCSAAVEEPSFPLSELKEYYIPPDGDLQSYKVRPKLGRGTLINVVLYISCKNNVIHQFNGYRHPDVMLVVLLRCRRHMVCLSLHAEYPYFTLYYEKTSCLAYAAPTIRYHDDVGRNFLKMFLSGVHQAIPEGGPPRSVRAARERRYHESYRGNTCLAWNHGEIDVGYMLEHVISRFPLMNVSSDMEQLIYRMQIVQTRPVILTNKRGITRRVCRVNIERCV